jgi:hypothetical protein
MPITLDGSNGITTPMYNGSITANAVTPSVNMKNRIINGAMVIDQRNAGAATANTISGYTLDRWIVGQTVTGKLIAQQNAGSVTPPAGFSNYLGITSQSAYSVGSGDLYYIQQAIEGFNTSDLNFGSANAKTVTISFWVRSSLTGNFGGSLYNNAVNRLYPFSYTISVANTWEQKTVTIAGDTSGTWVGATNGAGAWLLFSVGAGSGMVGTANAWANGSGGSGPYAPTGSTSVVGTNGATFYITGVQLEVGSTATSFDYRPYGTELALCQRYYIKFAGMGAGEFGAVAVGTAAGSSTAELICFLPVELRTKPTISFGGNVYLADGNAYPSLSAIGQNWGGRTRLYFSATPSTATLTLGRGVYMYTNTASTDFFALSAEL